MNPLPDSHFTDLNYKSRFQRENGKENGGFGAVHMAEREAQTVAANLLFYLLISIESGVCRAKGDHRALGLRLPILLLSGGVIITIRSRVRFSAMAYVGIILEGGVRKCAAHNRTAAC